MPDYPFENEDLRDSTQLFHLEPAANLPELLLMKQRQLFQLKSRVINVVRSFKGQIFTGTTKKCLVS